MDTNNYFNIYYSTESNEMDEEKQNTQLNSQFSKLQTQTSTNNFQNQLQLTDPKTQKIKVTNLNIKPIICPNNKQLNLLTGLSITDDGVIRFYTSINQVCFGLQQQQVVQVEDNNKLGIVNIQLCRDSGYIEHSIEQIINYISTVPHIPFNNAYKDLWWVHDSVQIMRQTINASQDALKEEQKNYEFQKLTGLFFKFLEKYNELNPHQMYHYSIGRINVILQDLEFIHNGYSKSYLDFLGMNASILNQIILRNKQVDLIRNKQDITCQGLKGIENMFEKNQGYNGDEIYESNITTFDGFPIKVIQTKKDCTATFGLQKFFGQEFEYEFVITEIDVDLYDLQQLIQYRQRIAQDNISFDDFLSRELSYLFEDVEYSIQSLEFVQKFYNNNIKALKEIQQFKKKDQSNMCGYRRINQ